MNCIIVDDEPLAVDLLEDFINRIPFLTLTGKCRNAFEAIHVMSRQEVDLMFLDIQMPNVNGVQLIQGLEHKPFIIFTTAFSEYAVESYNLNAVDYLLKPFDFSRFFKAVNKSYGLFTSSKSGMNESIRSDVSENEANYIFVKADYKTIKINLDDILYIEGLKDYVKIFAGPKPVLTLQSLKALEERLPRKKFIRTHRSFIVSLSKIESIDKCHIIIGSARIPIGDSFKDDFDKFINDYNLLR